MNTAAIFRGEATVFLGGKDAVQEITAAVFRRGKSRHGTFNTAAIFREESPSGRRGALFTATIPVR